MDVRHLKLMAVLAHPDDESLSWPTVNGGRERETDLFAGLRN